MGEVLAVNNASMRARWKVMWVAKGRIISKEFATDLAGASQLYAKAVTAQKRAATLCCTNMGFPPPDKYLPRVVRKKKRGARGKVVILEGTVTPMRKINARDIWWCPYCMQMRKFVKKKGFYVKGIWVAEPGYHCPLCTVSHRDGAVRKWNPMAQRMLDNPPWQRVRSRSATPTRRRRR